MSRLTELYEQQAVKVGAETDAAKNAVQEKSATKMLSKILSIFRCKSVLIVTGKRPTTMTTTRRHLLSN